MDVERWVLEQITETLRVCWNTIEHDTCIGRDINQSRIMVDKLLHNKEITGHERFEKFGNYGDNN